MTQMNTTESKDPDCYSVSIDIQKKMKVERRNKSGSDKISELFSSNGLLYLAKLLGKERRVVLIRLGLKDAEIERIEQDYRYTTDWIRTGFEIWNTQRKKEGDNEAKRAQDLVEVLEELGLKDIADHITDTYDFKAEVKSPQPTEKVPCIDEKEDGISLSNGEEVTVPNITNQETIAVQSNTVKVKNPEFVNLGKQTVIINQSDDKTVLEAIRNVETKVDELKQIMTCKSKEGDDQVEVMNQSTDKETLQKSAKQTEEAVEQTVTEGKGECTKVDSQSGVCSKDVSQVYLPLRDYQLEIARPGIKGENCIIWAATGSGKTRVALHIMQSHLDNNPTGRIVYFANTIPLLNQQYAAIWKHLPTYQDHILKCSGDDPISNEFHLLFRVNRVCVVTPMILQRCLDNKSVELSAFTMLVFDECHHTRKEETYNKIMAHYRKLKYRGDSRSLPQIIGLTASFGTEKAKNVEEAEESAYRLMARLDANTIATPQIHKEEYKKFVPDPEHCRECMVIRSRDPFREVIVNAMKNIEGLLRNETNKDDEIAQQMQILPVNFRSEPQYQSWLSSFGRYIKLRESLPNDISYSLAVAKNHLQMYHDALKVNKILCMKDVLEQLNGSSVKYNLVQGQSQDFKREMVDIYKDVNKELNVLQQDRANENPNIVRLGEIVDGIFGTVGKDSTCIIFVETREAAIATQRFIQKACQNAKCCFLIGSKTLGESKDEQSPVEQQKAVQDLRDGICNVLLTTLGEEGLDLPACNAVINYNTPSNDISISQKAGRIRKQSGKVIYFGDNVRWQAEALSLERVKLMDDALNNIQKKTHDSIKEKIENLQREIAEEEEQQEEREMTMDKIWKTKERFELICSRCKTPAVGSNGIRCYMDSQYIVTDKDFYGKIRRRPNRKHARVYMEHIDKRHKIECKECSLDWGAGANIKGVFCALIKIASYIVIDHDTDKRYASTKWSNLPFKVTPMTDEDLTSLTDIDDIVEDVSC